MLKVPKCVFCINEQRTIENYDATVFFSVAQLIRHLSRHPRPVRFVDGIKVCYGNQNNLDFGLNFISMDAKPNPLGNINARIANLPTARAILADRPKPGKGSPTDPDGKPTLKFANGAYIVGISFQIVSMANGA